MLGRTFAQLKQLYIDGRNHIWTFVLRNLLRPVWLSHPDHRAGRADRQPALDRLSPPERRNEGQAPRGAAELRSLGRRPSRHAPGHVRAVLGARSPSAIWREGGTLALVLPYAALNAPVFAGDTRGETCDACGRDHRRLGAGTRVADLRRAVGAASTTSTCVLFGERDGRGPLPAEIRSLGGRASAARCQRGRGERPRRSIVVRAPWPRAADADRRVALPEAGFRQGTLTRAADFFPRGATPRVAGAALLSLATPRACGGGSEPQQAALDNRSSPLPEGPRVGAGPFPCARNTRARASPSPPYRVRRTS